MDNPLVEVLGGHPTGAGARALVATLNICQRQEQRRISLREILARSVPLIRVAIVVCYPHGVLIWVLPTAGSHPSAEQRMVKHILIPTDGSLRSAQAVKEGLALARATGARVTGLFVPPAATPLVYKRFVPVG